MFTFSGPQTKLEEQKKQLAEETKAEETKKKQSGWHRKSMLKSTLKKDQKWMAKTM